ncbi:MAG: DUF2442 domain-containing protein [Candidatus Babeliales bacterium]
MKQSIAALCFGILHVSLCAVEQSMSGAVNVPLHAQSFAASQLPRIASVLVSAACLAWRVYEQEYFMPFTQFPWFLKATVEQIYNLEFFHGKHLHWPDLDIDLDIESIEHPETYPLLYS